MIKDKLSQLYLKPIILMFISIILYYYDFRIASIIMLFVFLVDNFFTLSNFIKKENDTEYLKNTIRNHIDKNISSIVLPIVVIKAGGEIIWRNSTFNELTGEEDFLGKNIGGFARGINIEKILTTERQVSHQRIRYDRKMYDVEGTSVENGEDVFGIIYFNNIGDFLVGGNSRETVMLLEVDNLNEALDTTEESNRPLVVAEVERNITTYAHNINAMIKKYDSNKFILSVQDKYIEQQMEEKFPILDEISNINKGNKLELTLSIGIGRNGATPLENHTAANFAMELALGRGGDQVVVKSNEDIKFFGGNTKEVEKRTRVRARVISHALMELIYDSSKVYIMGHNNPDMDCFGAALALSSAVKQMGKECNIVLNNDTKPIEYFLTKLKKDSTYNDRFISVKEAKEGLDGDALVIVVDVHNKGYVSDLSLVNSAKKKVIIDHHRRSPDMISGAILNYIEVYASSTSEMITEIIQYFFETPRLTQIEADGLLAGIFMDTKGFSFKTGVRTFEAASFLRNLGADPIEVKQMFTDNLDEYLLIADTIKSAEVDSYNKIAIAVCHKNADTVIIAKAADELLNISGIEVGFVLASINGDINISGRSIGDVNVQTILEPLGGGGHMNIAGAKVYNSTIDDVIVQLKEAIKKQLRKGE